MSDQLFRVFVILRVMVSGMNHITSTPFEGEARRLGLGSLFSQIVRAGSAHAASALKTLPALV